MRAAVLGSPIGHSLSPVLHRAAYAALRLEGWSYDQADVADAAGLQAYLDGLGDDWAGLSLTMPLKRLVRPLLAGVDAAAELTGAVNTVLPDGGEPGRRVGANTDVHGVAAALGEGGVDALGPGESVLLGGGATAASALAAVVGLGDTAPTLAVRSAARSGEVVAVGERLGADVRLVPLDAVAPLLAGARTVVSTVPVAGADVVAGLVQDAADAPAPLGTLLDVVYEAWPTAPARAWQRAGGQVVDGFVMLLHQAAAQVQLMTGRDVGPLVLQAMRDAGRAALAARDE